MGLWDKLKRRVRDELAERAAKAAMEKGTAAAKSAVKNAGDTIERALFGDAEPARKDDEPEGATSIAATEPKAKDAQAFFAEQRRKEREAAAARAAARADERAKLEREVDDELAALKNKLGKK